MATALGQDILSESTYSLPGAVVVLSLALYPLSMLATEMAMRGIDGRLEEAALIVAPPRRVLWRITLPLAAPSILAAALMIFVLAVSEFGVPGLLRVRVYTTEVFTAFAALYDFTRAMRPSCSGIAS
jgi:ABC-type Fe3+ transport system permease subunit